MKWSRMPSIRMRLVMFAVGCIVPIACVAAFLIVDFYRHEQKQLIGNAIYQARAMVSSIDRDFANTQASLYVLGTSHRLASRDLSGFRARAAQALRNMRAETIVNVDMHGQLLLSTSLPFGAPLPKLNDAPLLRRIAESGKAEVSDLYIGPIANRYIYTVAIPVMKDDKMVSLLGATFAPAQLSDMLNRQNLPHTWRVGIIDSSGKVVARTHDIEKFIGRKITPELLRRMDIADEGYYQTTTLDGIPVVTVYSRSRITRWSAAIGIPLNELSAGLRQTLLQLIATTFSALAIGLALAWFIGGSITRSVKAIGSTALALSFGEKLIIPRLYFREAEEIGKALLGAESTLRKSRYDAHHDALTDMTNRTLFHFIAEQQMVLCRRNGTALSILYIDLDGFKSINDTYGHAAGDEVLRMVSARIKASIRDSDIAARLGGDEFAVALIDTAPQSARTFAVELIERISRPYPVGSVEATLSASIGIASYPLSASDIDTLLKRADKAMYRAKALGKGRVCAAQD